MAMQLAIQFVEIASLPQVEIRSGIEKLTQPRRICRMLTASAGLIRRHAHIGRAFHFAPHLMGN